MNLKAQDITSCRDDTRLKDWFRRLGLDPEWGRAWLLEVQVWSPDIKKVTERGAPAWSQSKAQQDEQSWSCPQCSTRVPDIQSAIKAHKRKCPAKPKPRAKRKSKADAEPAAKRRLEESCQSPPVPELDRTGAPERDSREASTQPERFFERQVQLRCGIHALNNALGFHLVNAQDMVYAADAFLFENPELADNVQDHLRPQGDYSFEVMSMVLRTKAMEAFGQLRWQMEDRRARNIKDLEGCVGAVQHRSGRHWVALRRSRETFLFLDSLEAQPRDLTVGQLEEILSSHPTYAVRRL